MKKAQDILKKSFKDVICFDIDDTLILWSEPKDFPAIQIEIIDPRDGSSNKVWIHSSHVEFLKDQHTKGRTILAWSQGGAQWVDTVINALNIDNFVHIKMSKPFAFVDDLESVHWMQNRIWIGNEPRLGSNPEKAKQHLDDLEEWEIF